MPSFTLNEILACTGGSVLAGHTGSCRVSGVSTDTRTIRRNQLFIALKGGNFDGHDFLAKAVAMGATVLVVSRADVPRPRGAVIVLVKDTLDALGAIALYHRRRFSIPLIAITGSAGKTSTKELVAAVLRGKYRVLFNKGTLNNQIGVPSTLLKLTRRHEMAVVELGTNHPGEIAWLARHACPTVAVFTNVGASHLEGLGSLDGVYKEKAALFASLPDKGCVVLNADDPYWRKLLGKRSTRKMLSYGIKAKAGVRATAVAPGPGGLHFRVGADSHFFVKSFSQGAVYNALAAIACGRLFGVPADKIAEALRGARPAKGRQCCFKAAGVTVIDDTYNANPVSYKNALQSFSAPRRGRAVLVAGDMLELGAGSDELHAGVGKAAAAAGVDLLLTYGRGAKLIGEAARRTRPGIAWEHGGDQDALTTALKKILRRGDVLLVKGSRGMRMEKVVQDIMAFLKG